MGKGDEAEGGVGLGVDGPRQVPDPLEHLRRPEGAGRGLTLRHTPADGRILRYMRRGLRNSGRGKPPPHGYFFMPENDPGLRPAPVGTLSICGDRCS